MIILKAVHMARQLQGDSQPFEEETQPDCHYYRSRDKTQNRKDLLRHYVLSRKQRHQPESEYPGGVRDGNGQPEE
jgi:hypothetical protein